MNPVEEGQKIIDINKILRVLLDRWYIIVGFVLIAFVFTFIKLRYTESLYTASINIKFDDERNNQLNDFFRYGRASGRIDNMLKTESEILRSRSISAKTLKALNYTFAYQFKGKILTSTLYPNNLFNTNLIYADSSIIGSSFTLIFTGPDRFTYENKKYHTGDTILINGGLFTFQITDGKKLSEYYGIPVSITCNNMLELAKATASAIETENIKGTSILQISYTSNSPEFATDFVNKLTEVYIQENINNKSQMAEQTSRFIEIQLAQLSADVEKSQQNLTAFKASNLSIKPEDLSKAEFEQSTKTEADREIELMKKRMLVDAIKEVTNAENRPIRLVTIDIEAGESISSLQDLLNNVILERMTKQQQYNSQSKLLQEYNNRINEIKTALLAALHSALSQTEEKIKLLNRSLSESNANLRALPSKEQLLVNLERNYRINEKIFSYLLEKRQETLIGKASITSSISVIDPALLARKVFPDENRFYTMAIGIALVFSLTLIAFMRFSYDKIPDKETIESLSKTPVIGLIRRLRTSETELAQNNYAIHALNSPKSIFSESIRGIRTNINYLLENEKNKVISLTSTVSGEGKTFCTLNLAASLTLLGNKVLVIGCDLRRPKIHHSFKNIDNRSGLTTFLFGKHTLEEVIRETEYAGLSVIPAGPVPPNPSELLQSDKMGEALYILRKQYDYVFLDTAPVGLVSDSFAIFTLSDINLYILRAQYSKRDFALIPDRLAKDNDIKKMYIILNSYDSSGNFYGSIYKNEYGGYYGGGGYYYYGGNFYGRYGYYGRKSDKQYYGGYYTHEEVTGKSQGLLRKIKERFKFKKS